MLSKAMLYMQSRQKLPLLARSRLIQTQAAPFSLFGNHRDEEDNLDETPFEFTEESYKAIDVLLTYYPSNYKSSAVIPVLTIAQKQNNNFLTLAAMHKTAKILEMTPMQVYEVASFYTMFNRTRVGKYHLQVCGTTPCMIRGVSQFQLFSCLIFTLGWRGHPSNQGLQWWNWSELDIRGWSFHTSRS